MSEIVLLVVFSLCGVLVGWGLTAHTHLMFRKDIQQFFKDELDKAEQEIKAKTKELQKAADDIYLELYKRLSETPKPLEHEIKWDKDTLN